MARKDYSRTLRRLFTILKRLDEHGVVETQQLAEDFGVSRRTIQKDMAFLKGLGLIEEAGQRGAYRHKKGATILESDLDQEEIIVLLFALKPLETSEHLRHIGQKIVQKILRSSRGKNPLVFKGEGLEDLDPEEPRVRHLLEAIDRHQVVEASEEEGRTWYIEPYRILNFDGLWYLFGKDLARERLDIWALADIDTLGTEPHHFTPDEEEIEETIEEEVHSPWFEDGQRFDVVIRVSAKIADHFRLRPLLSTQRIVEEHDDGALTVRFTVTHDEDVDNLVKSWLPDVEVLEPERYRRKLLDELHAYLEGMKK